MPTQRRLEYRGVTNHALNQGDCCEHIFRAAGFTTQQRNRTSLVSKASDPVAKVLLPGPEESVLLRLLAVVVMVCVVVVGAPAEETKKAESRPVQLQGTYVWKNPLRATLTPIQDQGGAWDLDLVATYHRSQSTYRGALSADMAGGAVTGKVKHVKGPNGRTRSWTFRGKVKDGVLTCATDEVGGEKDVASIELKPVEDKEAGKSAAPQPLEMEGHYVFGKNNKVEATLTPVDGQANTWEAVFTATYQNIRWTYTGTVLADLNGGKVSGKLLKDGSGPLWAVEGDIRDGVLKCACDDTTGKETSATIEMKVVNQIE
jgi:hypothetical protein